MTAYLDHAATTPMLAGAIAAMTEQMAALGNASSPHGRGRAVQRVVEESREGLARAIGARPAEVIFTSGGTESDNLAVAGTFQARMSDEPRRRRIVTTGIEHQAVRDCVEHLVSHHGAAVSWVEPDSEGLVSAAAVRKAIAEDPYSVALVTVMWANNEVGAIQPVREIVAAAHEFGVPVHTDAVQALGQVPLDFGDSGADLMSITAHTIGGPAGIGALVAKRNARIVPRSFGGRQEQQLRGGTLNAPAIRAFAVAAQETLSNLEARAEELVDLRDRLIMSALALGHGISVTGPWKPGDVARRLPGNAHLIIPGCRGDALVHQLDAAGVSCSTGSPWQARQQHPSHVLLAMGLTEERALSALRLTLGHSSTDADVDTFLRALPAAIQRVRRAGRAT